MSGGNWQPHPGDQPPRQSWSSGWQIAVAASVGLVVGLAALGVLVVASSDDDDGDTDQAAGTDETTPATRAETTTAPPPTTAPPMTVVPPEGYTQAQADAFVAEVAAAVPTMPPGMHQNVLNLNALFCDTIGIWEEMDTDLGGPLIESYQDDLETDITEALELSIPAADAEEQAGLLVAGGADAAAEHLCPEHAEHIRID